MEVSHFQAAQGGQLGFDGPAKALLLPVTVRALQIGNPEEIICKEHVHRWCRIQPSQTGGDGGKKSQKAKQPHGTKQIKAFQSFEQHVTAEKKKSGAKTNSNFPTRHYRENKTQHRYCIVSCAAIRLFVCQECVVHIPLIFKQKLSISLTSAATLSFARFLPYLLEHVGQIALPRGIWPGQMQRLTTRIKVILFRGRIILAS